MKARLLITNDRYLVTVARSSVRNAHEALQTTMMTLTTSRVTMTTSPIPQAALISLRLIKMKVCQLFVIAWPESKVLSKKGLVKHTKDPRATKPQQVQKLTKVNLE